MKMPERMRREFEEWCRSEPWIFNHSSRPGDGYWLPATNAAWLAWQEQERRITALMTASGKEGPG